MPVSPSPLDQKTLVECAAIVGVKEIPRLQKLVEGAHVPYDHAYLLARREIVKKGRVFVKTIKSAPSCAAIEIETALPFGANWLNVILDIMAPKVRTTRLRNRQFVVLLCMLVHKAGGKLTLNEKEGTGTLVDLLGKLSSHLPAGFVPTANTLREANEAAANWSKHLRE